MRSSVRPRAVQFAVKFTWLLAFAEKYRLRERRWTPAQLVKEVVRPKTATGRTGCSYAELLVRTAPPGQLQDTVSSGRPFFFVSHAWSQPLSDTLDMLARHFSPEQQRCWRHKGSQALPLLNISDIYCWFDIFAIVSAHSAADTPHPC